MVSSSRSDNEKALRKILQEPSSEVKALLDESAGRGRGRGRQVRGREGVKEDSNQEKKKGQEEKDVKGKDKISQHEDVYRESSRVRTAHTIEGKQLLALNHPSRCSCYLECLPAYLPACLPACLPAYLP